MKQRFANGLTKQFKLNDVRNTRIEEEVQNSINNQQKKVKKK